MTTTTPVYELWDVETGNLIANYAEEYAALANVRAGIDDDGLAAWETVELVRAEPDGTRMPVARGATLVRRALAPLNLDWEALDTAKVFVSTLSDPNFRRALNDFRVELRRIISEVATDLDDVRAAARYLSTVSGVTVRVDIDGPRVWIVTPSKSMAELLAVSAPPVPKKGDTPIRAVTDGYAVDIAA